MLIYVVLLFLEDKTSRNKAKVISEIAKKTKNIE